MAQTIGVRGPKSAVAAGGGALDLFLTHGFRPHDDWERAAALLDQNFGLGWRNFSVPWHDPALDPNTEADFRSIEADLLSQITFCHVVLFLDGIYRTRAGRRWMDVQVAIARDLGKPIIGLPPWNETALSKEGRALVTAVGHWNRQRPLIRMICAQGNGCG